MTREEFFYPGSDGVHRIHAILWKPEGEIRGVVQFIHGICEYAGRCDPFAQYLADHGFVVVCNDHLGHGQSVTGPEEYGYFEDWWNLVYDVRALRLKMDEMYAGLPYFMLGHSMGSFVARTYLFTYPGTVTGCMLSGTGYLNPAEAALAKWIAGWGDPHEVNKAFYRVSIGAYNKTFAPNRTAADWISSDEATVDKYLADPLCHFPTKGAMNKAMMTGLQLICRRKPLRQMDPDTPIYFFSGDRDPVGKMGKGVRKVAKMFQQAGCRDVTLKLYPGGRHEMLGEVNQAQVWADTLGWLEKYL